MTTIRLAPLVLLGLLACTKNAPVDGPDRDVTLASKGEDFYLQHHAYEPVSGQPLVFRLPPGAAGVTILTNVLARKDSLPELDQIMRSDAGGLDYAFSYELTADDGRVVKTGQFHGVGRYTEYRTVTKGIAKDRHFVQRADVVALENQVLRVPLGDAEAEATTLRLKRSSASPLVQSVLYRVTTKRETPAYRRLLAWGRMSPVLRKLTIASTSYALDELPDQDLENLMRWQEEPRAPRGQAKHDFVETMLYTRPLTELQPIAPSEVSPTSLVGPELARVYRVSSMKPLATDLCAQALNRDHADKQVSEDSSPVVLTVRHFATKNALPTVLFEGELPREGLRERLRVPAGFVEVRATGMTRVDLLEAARDALPSCTMREGTYLKDSAQAQAAHRLDADNRLALPLLPGARAGELNPIRIEAYQRRSADFAAEPPSGLEIAIIGRRGETLRRIKQAANGTSTPYLRVSQSGETWPATKVASLVLSLPETAHRLILSSKTELLVTAELGSNRHLPVTIVPEPVMPDTSMAAGGVSADRATRAIWHELSFTNESVDGTKSKTTNDDPFRVLAYEELPQLDGRTNARSPKPQSWVNFEAEDGKSGRIVLEKMGIGIRDGEELASGYLRLTAGRGPKGVSGSPALSYGGANLVYENPLGETNHVQIDLNGRCYWQADIAGREGELKLPPTAPFLGTEAIRSVQLFSSSPLTAWMEGLKPDDEATPSYRKKFYYELAVGKPQVFRVIKGAENPVQTVNFQVIPEKPLTSGEEVTLAVEVDARQTRRLEPLAGWTALRRLFRIREIEPQSLVVILGRASKRTKSAPRFGFRLEEDLPPGEYMTRVTQVSGPPSYIALFSSFAGLLKSQSVQVSFDISRARDVRRNCGS